MNIQRVSGFLHLISILKSNQNYQENYRIQNYLNYCKFSNHELALAFSRIMSEDLGASGATKTALLFTHLNSLNTPIDYRIIRDVIMDQEQKENHSSFNSSFGYALYSKHGENPILTECFYILSSIAGLLFHKNEDSHEDLLAYSDIELYSLINKLSMLHEEHLPLFAEYQIHTLFQDIISENDNIMKLHPRSERLIKNIVNL